MSFGNDILVCFDRISGRMISEMKLLIREKKGISIIQRYVSKSDNTSYTQMTGFFSVIYNLRLQKQSCFFCHTNPYISKVKQQC